MYVYERRRERLRELLREISQAELARASGIAASTISRYLKEPGSKGAKNMTEGNARKLETAAKKTPGWLDKTPPSEGIKSGGVSPLLPWRGIADAQIITPVTVAWGSNVSGKLPPVFTVALPDDALAPEFRKGQTVVFSTTEGEPRADDAVLVADAEGNWFARIYRARRPGHWQAVALASGFDTLDSAADGLTVLAVAMGKWGRRGQ